MCMHARVHVYMCMCVCISVCVKARAFVIYEGEGQNDVLSFGLHACEWCCVTVSGFCNESKERF